MQRTSPILSYWRRFCSLPTYGSSDRTGAARLATFLSSIRRRACILSRTDTSFRTGDISSLESRTLTGSYCTCYFVGRQPHIVRNKHRTLKMAFEPSILRVALKLRQTKTCSVQGATCCMIHVVSSSPKVDADPSDFPFLYSSYCTFLFKIGLFASP